CSPLDLRQAKDSSPALLFKHAFQLRVQGERGMNPSRRLWVTLAVLFATSFGLLGWLGGEIYREAPPLPTVVLADNGESIYTRESIERGRQVWQSMGGMQVGSIWGHGGYLAPDWSADWLHREAVGLLEMWSERDFARPFDELGPEQQAALEARLQ